MATTQQKASKNATFRVPKAIWQRAKKRAIAQERSLNEVVVTALEAYGGQHQKPGARLLADADQFIKRRGKNVPARHFTPEELHENDDA